MAKLTVKVIKAEKEDDSFFTLATELRHGRRQVGTSCIHFVTGSLVLDQLRQEHGFDLKPGISFSDSYLYAIVHLFDIHQSVACPIVAEFFLRRALMEAPKGTIGVLIVEAAVAGSLAHYLHGRVKQGTAVLHHGAFALKFGDQDRNYPLALEHLSSKGPAPALTDRIYIYNDLQHTFSPQMFGRCVAVGVITKTMMPQISEDLPYAVFESKNNRKAQALPDNDKMRHMAEYVGHDVWAWVNGKGELMISHRYPD